MDRRTSTRLSKFLSLVLRHRPDEYDLEMDAEGFVDFDSLIDVLVAEDILAENAEEDVRELVEGSDRKRFEIANGRIRALYGHSSRIRLNYPADDPPPLLYHGTTAETARRVAEEGLQPAGRALVHLSATEEEALSVGKRHTESPVLIRVDTAAALRSGIGFHRATDLIWLCSSLPVDVLDIPEVPEGEDADDAPEEGPVARRTPPRPAQGPIGPRAGTRGFKVVQPDSSEGFQRRTRKKGDRRR
jgi:putative RNA 2'-phosphotransferase